MILLPEADGGPRAHRCHRRMEALAMFLMTFHNRLHER
jgi:hypothetical protein